MNTTSETMTMSKTPKATRRAARPTTSKATRRPAATGEADARRQPQGAAQTEAGGAGTPLAPTAANPSQSAQTDRDATTSRAEAVSPASRLVARAILSTLTPDAAACVLVALAGFASAIINAASMLRHATGEGARRAASTMLDAAAGDGFDGLDGEHTATAAYTVCAAWWFSTPCDVVASFWRDDIARANVEAQARGALAEVDVMRLEVARPLAMREKAVVLGADLPPGIDRLDTRDVSFRAEVPRVLRVEAHPFAAKSITAAVGHVLYLTPSTAEGYGDIASGLAGLVSGDSDATDAAGLVSGLAQVATMHASVAVEAREVCDARTHLNDALDALDAAGRVARFTLDALDAAPGEALAPDVKVCAV